MGWKKKLAATVVVLAIALVVYEYKTYNSGPDCSQISLAEASKRVNEDYLQRLKSWEKEVGKLGTSEPTITIDREKAQVSDVWFMPFTAAGPSGELKLFATLSCKSGVVEYSVQ